MGNGSQTQAKKLGFWFWVSRLIMLATLSVAMLVVTGTVYQFIASKVAQRKYPPPGEMIDIGGYRLHLYCTGSGATTVILDAGLGGGVLDWTAIQPEVAKFARVCSYDRAGVGWSEQGPAPRSSRQFTRELHELLSRSATASPYVVVGHSLGGLNMQLFASEYLNETAGVVLVDSSHELQASTRDMPSPPPSLATIFKGLAPIGGGRLIAWLSSGTIPVPPGIAVERAAVYATTRHMLAVTDELADFVRSMNDAHGQPMHLGDKPLIVLTRGKRQKIPLLAPEALEKADDAWRRLQAELVTRSTRGKQVIAEKSGHFIQFDQPEVVIDAIRQVISDSAQGRVK